MIADRKNRILSLAVFLLPPLLLLALEALSCERMCMLTADARLYLSIADNALANGHFIQTAREIEGFVVPPGLPLCLLLLRLARFTVPMIAGVQGLLMGCGCLLLYRTAKGFFGPVRGLAAPAVYTAAYLRCRLYLGNIFVEHWYLFLLCAIAALLFREPRDDKRLVLLNLAGLALLLTRPAMAVVYAAILLYTAVSCFRRKKPGLFALLLAVPLVLLGLNLLVNYRETGEWVLLQNYSGTDLYRSSCPQASVTRREEEDFNDPVYYQVMEDGSLSMGQKSEVLMRLAKTNIREDPGGFFGKALVRGLTLFLTEYRYCTLLALLGAFLMLPHCGRTAGLLSLAVNLTVALLTALGIPEIRYTMPIWPLASLHCAALFSWAAQKLRRRREGQAPRPGG